MSTRAILVADDDPDIGTVLAKALRGPGRTIEVVESAAEALRRADEKEFAVAVCDMRMEKETSGLELLRALGKARPAMRVILMSAYSTLETAVEAVRAGAFDYVAKPFDIREVMTTVDRALAAEEEPPAEAPAAPSPLPAGLIGRTPEMLAVYKQIALAADALTPVLIAGESGTGKELVARAIHDYGRSRNAQMVAVNCGALAESLIESELFGHVRGAFTGAVSDKRGLFEQAGAGTIFLDEIGETSAALQVKLLRVLQESEVTPVGGVRPVKVKARVVAATNRDLAQEVAEKRFRQDLYYRLSAFIIRVPPLRERPDDIPLLTGQFLHNACFRARKEVRLADDAMEALRRHGWAGNVRELENAVERLVIAARAATVTGGDVDEALAASPAPAASAAAFGDLPTLDELERRYLLHVLEAAGGNRTKAAKILGIDRRTLYRMAARFGAPLAADAADEPDAG